MTCYRPMEPMDSYLCVLLKLGLITVGEEYSHSGVCAIITKHLIEFETAYNDSVQRSAARAEYIREIPFLSISGKKNDWSRELVRH